MRWLILDPGHLRTCGPCLGLKTLKCFKDLGLNGLRRVTLILVFFHASSKSRSRRNIILSLKVGEEWIEGLLNIIREVVELLTKIFK